MKKKKKERDEIRNIQKHITDRDVRLEVQFN